MGIEWDHPAIEPGQFVMVKPNSAYDPLLRRPFGIYSVSKGKGMELLYKVVGRGTAIMAGLAPGEKVDVLGPLGNFFPAPRRGKEVLMVAGGIGVASLKIFAERHKNSTLIYGARTKVEARLAGDIKKLGVRTIITTEDGSAGVKGLVTDVLKKEMARDSIVYACGPMAMLKAVSKISGEADVKCLVSLERSMACGVGACLGCAVKTLERGMGCNHNDAAKTLKMVCADGPVFDATAIDWENL
jgi:dihydroorotate dehydrogenase electron transfer subunit